jgi:hypothetical protein
MKIALLLDREPFPSIFEETMERYLASVTGRPHRVRWKERAMSERLQPPSRIGTWLCNPLVNAVFRPQAHRGVFEIPWRSYGSGAPTPRLAAQQTYLMAATALCTRNFMAEYAITFDPEIRHAPHLLIVGGNTRLRLYDFQRNEAVTILKERFDESFVGADVALRTAHPWLPAPDIRRVIDGGRAYVEPILGGKVAAMLKDADEIRRSLEIAVAACDRLAVGTSYRQPLAVGITEILAKCRSIANSLRARDRRTGERILACLARMGTGIAELDIADNIVVEMGESHGDLQAGNVVVEPDGIRLLDWERTGTRICGFDALTLALKPRPNATGLVKRAWRLAFQKENAAPGARLGRIALNGNGRPGETRGRLSMFLLEELRFHLEENVCGPISTPTRGLDLLLRELENETETLFKSTVCLEMVKVA